jgi:hypothetical protein
MERFSDSSEVVDFSQARYHSETKPKPKTLKGDGAKNDLPAVPPVRTSIAVAVW